jgi:SOS response associated peptidase (SRAP)
MRIRCSMAALRAASHGPGTNAVTRGERLLDANLSAVLNTPPIAVLLVTAKAIGGLWENWKDPTSGEWIRTFAIITTDANELVAEIHDRMPLILAPADYARWLSEEPDPGDLMRPFPGEPMRMWPISTRVNKPENDDPTIVDPVELTA